MWIEAISGGGVTPTPITPSNTTPASMTSGTAYEPTANGYAISSYSSITPSGTPEYLYSSDIYKLTVAGWIIDGWGNVTPTAEGTYFASGMRKMSTSGYAYSQKPKLKIGTFTPSSSRFSVTGVGFKPKYLAIYTARTDETLMGCMYIYNEDFSTTKYIYSSGDATGALRNIGETGNYRLYSIDNDGFTINGYSTASWRGTGYYFALG